MQKLLAIADSKQRWDWQGQTSKRPRLLAENFWKKPWRKLLVEFFESVQVGASETQGTYIIFGFSESTATGQT